ncbi:hypothetical protein DPMN_004140 [Dreissena polymorpha]|uniref:Uncharacterized protein n=2 Tax=Dreissena polymorpha TaxID=45954 RepID=A0A9D4RVD7_DREPO|nr:hypothetical protein DPMN_004140 [Dreissena polymorpha]
MKVNNIGHGQDFSFFITKDLHFTNIIALLDYYQTQGLAVVDNENRTPGHQKLVPMATAVRVKYTTSV